MGIGRAMRYVVRSIGVSGEQGDLFYTKTKYFAAKVMHSLLGDEGYAKWFVKLYLHKKLNLEHPSTTSDKFWWLKLNNRDPLLTQCSDKVAARDYVSQCGYSDILIPQYEVLSSVDQLDLSKYQEEVIVKCSHNSGGHLFYNPQNPPQDQSFQFAKKRLSFLLRQNASTLSLEWNYKNIPPRLVVEKVIRDDKGSLPYDYKFWCMDGVPKIMFHIGERYNSDNTFNLVHKTTAYDMDYNVLPFDEVGAPYSHVREEKPDNWEYMIEIAKKLSEPFPFCRVDLYNINGKVYFGELTFYDAGGCIAFEPKEWDDRIASWINIDSDKVHRE